MSRVIAVTGGSSGIGAKIVEQFTNQGATVVILDRNQPSGSQDFVQCDLSDFAAIDSAVGALPAQLDVFVITDCP